MRESGRGKPREFLSAREVCARLGIKPQTLYAYVSRGLLRGVASGHGRARRYFADDVARLKARHDARSGHGAVAAGALRWGEPVLDTALTAIDARGPSYRGHVATELARAGVPFESVATLLWTGALPLVPARWERVDFGVEMASFRALAPARAGYVPVLSLLVAALGARESGVLAMEAELTRARATIARMTAGLALPRAPRRAEAALGAPSIAHAFAAAVGAPREADAARAIDRALVLSADHELNVSAFAARVAASSGADLFACLGAALAAFSGPVHGGASSDFAAIAAHVDSPARARAVVRELARRGTRIPGLGHPLYPKGDPRGAELIALACAIDPDAPAVRAITWLSAAAGEGEGGHLLEPNLDAGLVAFAGALRLPEGSASAIFAMGRTAGWVAHVLEQRAAGFLLRPRARYVGPEAITK